MVQLKGLTCHAHIVTLLWLILTTQLKITLSNPQFGNTSENDIFSVWTHTINTVPAFLDNLNNIVSIGKIKFTIQIADENWLKFLVLKFKMNENSKITVDVTCYTDPIISTMHLEGLL